MEIFELVSGLDELQHVQRSTHQRLSRKKERIQVLTGMGYDLGEEEVRLCELEPESWALRPQITALSRDIKKGRVTEDEAVNLFHDVASKVNSARAALDEIHVPKLRHVWAAERRTFE